MKCNSEYRRSSDNECIHSKISDDEDETHPNIDTPSLFRWRHQARVERMAESEKEKEELKKKRQSFEARLIDVKQRIEKKEGDEAALKVTNTLIEAINKLLPKCDSQKNRYL